MSDEPAAPAPKPSVRTDSSVEEAAGALVESVARSKSPMATILVTLLTGGGVAFGGWQTSNALTAQVAALTAKVDKLTEELVETRKDLAAASTTATAQRHEERIRELEEHDRTRERALDKIALEVEALKKAAPK